MLPTAPRALTQQAYETELAMEGAVIEASAGRVESGQSEAVPLLPVEPDTGYGVRVRYWASRSTADGTVQPSGWSSWLNFTTGLPSGCVLEEGHDHTRGRKVKLTAVACSLEERP